MRVTEILSETNGVTGVIGATGSPVTEAGGGTIRGYLEWPLERQESKCHSHQRVTGVIFTGVIGLTGII